MTSKPAPAIALALTACLTLLAPAVRAAYATTKPTKPSPDEQYVLGPDSKPQDGVPKGVVTKHVWDKSVNFPGTIHDYWVYVPAQYDGKTPACLWVSQDGIQYNAPVVFDNLIHKREMPVTIAIGVSPGQVASAVGQGSARFNRSVEFDGLDDALARCIVEEILPEVEARRTPDGVMRKLPESVGHAFASASSRKPVTSPMRRARPRRTPRSSAPR